jgi:hypothetical protein
MIGKYFERSGTMLYDLDPVPEDNTRKPEVKDYVDVKKQAAKLGPPTRMHEFAYLIF